MPIDSSTPDNSTLDTDWIENEIERIEAHVRQAPPRQWLGNQILPAASALPNMPSEKRWRALLDAAHAALITVEDEMDDYACERSAAWQRTPKAELFGNRAIAVLVAADAIDQLIQEFFD
jgi:hypothetical protein